ncbi:hypothetical protein HK103_003126 [Boothiomyces macroporosus]|uniref:Uncharacterized protein n=1 Tax=Boothiomyces macroporosus TaxID=261099 RepID=A0AAD5UJ66_9FUNG|nr:hypothetical protein HK103_003126 [Boothiomyces macroporosus]
MVLAQKWLTTAPWIRSTLSVSHPQKIKASIPSYAGWGAAVGILALFFVEVTPLFRREVFAKIPVVGGFWQKKLEDRARAD